MFAASRLKLFLCLAALICLPAASSAQLTNGAKYLFVHGRGDGSGASDANGGAYKGSATWQQSQDDNGGPVDAVTGASVRDNGAGKVRLNAIGWFDDAAVDVYAYCDFDMNYADGRYAITAISPGGDYIDIDLNYVGDASADVNVGGAFASIQAAVDAVGQGDCVKVAGGPYTHAANGSNIITCTVPVETGGSPAYAAMWNTITIEGVSADGEIDWNDKVVMDGSVEGLSTAIDIAPYYRVRNFDITGTSGSAIGRNGVDYIAVEGCVLRQCGGGVYVDNNGTVIRCVIENNSGRGIYADNSLKVIGTVFRGNGSDVVRMYSGEILYSTFTAGAAGVDLVTIGGTSGSVTLIGNTLDGRGYAGTVGLNFPKSFSSRPLLLNNIFADCQIGISFVNDVSRAVQSYHNLYYGNVNDVSPAGLVPLGQGAIFGDPMFADAAAGDYRLRDGSAAIGAGFDSTVIQFDAQQPLDQRPTGDSKIIAVHGRGDGSGADDANGGAFRGAVSWSEFQAADGAPLCVASGASVTVGNGLLVRITAPGTFADAVVDVYANCDFTSVYPDGRYPILAVDPAGDYIEIDLAYTADDTADLRVGGALASPQYAVDIVGQGDYVKIAGGPYTVSNSGSILDCAVAVDTGNTTMNLITIEGVNEDGLVDWSDKVVLDCTVEGASYGISHPGHYRLRNFEVVGAGITGIGDNAVDACIIEQCVARDGNGIGLRIDNGGVYLGCESYDNAGVGLDGDGAVELYGCTVRDNGAKEVEINYGSVMYSTIANADNSLALLRVSEQWTQPWYVVNNTFDGGGVAGIEAMQFGLTIKSTSPYIVLNNSVTNCGTGITSSGDMTRQSFIYNNLYHNTPNPVDPNGNVTDGINAVYGDPVYADAAAGDYTPLAGSACLNAGFDSAYTLYGASGMAIGSAGVDVGSHGYAGSSLKSGDANGDSAVDIQDFVILKQNYGTTGGALWSQGDFNGDGNVNIQDFVILKQNYGS